MSRQGFGLTMILILLAVQPLRAQAGAGKADLIFYNGKIVTVDSRFSVAEAVAISKGRITAVGKNDQVLALADADTQRVDLQGKTVIPGLVDTHSHVHDYSASDYGAELGASKLREYPINFKLVKTKDDVIKQMKTIMDTIHPKAGEWVSFASTGLTDAQVRMLWDDINRWDLDAATPDNPVVVSIGIPEENGLLVNSKAIDIVWSKYGAFIEKYGRYWIDGKGRPEGHLEPPANRFVLYRFKPKPAAADLARIYEKTLDEWTAMGVTTISTRLTEDSVKAYQFLESQGRLKARMAYGNEWIFGDPNPAETFRGLKMGAGSDMVWVVAVGPGGVDGSGARQCTDLKRAGKAAEDEGAMGQSALSDYYPRGQCHLDIEFKGAAGKAAPIRGNYYKEWLMALGKTDLRFANTHVAGDGSQSRMLAIMEEIDKEHPLKGKRWALDHCTIVDPRDIPRAAKLGVVWSCGPKYIAGAATLAKAYGEDVANRYVVPVKSMIDAGIHVAFEMDEDNYIWKDLELFVTRDANGKIWGPQERIDRADALRTITRWAAEYVLKEGQLGSIETGKLADLVVLDRDYMTIPEKEISEIQPQLTVLGGRITYLNPDFAARLNLKPAGAVIATYKDLLARRTKK